jgi:hypothetical protein
LAQKVKGKKLRQNARKQVGEKVGKGHFKKGRNREIKRMDGNERSKETYKERLQTPVCDT